MLYKVTQRWCQGRSHKAEERRSEFLLAKFLKLTVCRNIFYREALRTLFTPKEVCLYRVRI